MQIGRPPVIVTAPAGQTVTNGAKFALSAVATGVGPLAYQWRLNGTNISNYVITTVAGIGTATFSGDGGKATNAGLYYPQGVTFDKAGNLYIADDDNNRVRKVDTNGIITTVVGNGGSVFSGDGGLATSAGVYWPNHVAFDAQGNFYIASVLHYRIRKVDTKGIITTVAGTGSMNPVIDGGPATNSALFDPINVAFDPAGNWYICDLHHFRIRKVDTNGIITTVAGNGVGNYAGDGGAATNASLRAPQSVSLDAAGNLLIADSLCNRVRKVDADGIITSVAGNNSGTFAGDGNQATNASLNSPWFAAVDAYGNLFIADYGNNRIRKVDVNGVISTVAGKGTAAYSGDGGSATDASLNGPACVAFDAAGDLYIADWHNNRVRKVYLNGYPTLTRSNINATAAGDYTVVVSGQFGSVTSAVASVSVIVPKPQIIATGTSFGFLTNYFGFKYDGVVGQTIIVDGSTNLTTWIPLITNTLASTNAVYFFDPVSTNYLWRFYRARSP
ncbi:MAG: hypothetical protein P4N60_00500 [Verrucomicrobiae bacterium]|nr:hypothetical protein [Verrucomicrobiae bacterium]